MKHRRLLIGSIISIPVGLVLWLIIGTTIALAGISSHQEGWWIFSQTVTELTTTYWIGLTITIVGLISVIAGISGIIIAFVLEILDREKGIERTEAHATTVPTPPEA